jgi:tetratricopeptide (TPR) repeat protein
MGVVYKARDLSLRRFVALKFLPPEITASAARVARFEAEARAISALNHPNIATIHAMDEDHGRRFLVLEYLEGGTLRERIRQYRGEERPYPLAEAAAVGIQLAEGLAHAHRKGIVHRDIKPENVMFTGDGALRITDFGLAKSSHASEITRDGTTVGTAAYMGPEQALRNETSPRGDLFAVGVVLYELVAGRRPFVGSNELATLHAMLNEQPPALRILRPEAPPELERILTKLLEKDPALRYQTGDELARDLRAIDLTSGATAELNYSGVTRSLTRVIVSPTVPQTSQVAEAPPRRGRMALAAAVAVAGLAIAGLAWMKFGRGEALPAETQLAVLPFTAASGSPEDVAFGSGLAGIVAGKLASLGANVVPANDLARNRVTTPADARRVFGIPLVLTGRIERRASGAALVTLDVVDTGSGKALRSASVSEGAAGEPLQDEVLSRAAGLLRLSPSASTLSRARADNTNASSAYDYYVEGNGYLQRYDQAGNLGFAIAAFQKAIRIDPSYAMAYAGLGAAYWLQYRLGRDQQDLERAHDAALQAISRNESLAPPHITLGAIAVTEGQVDEGIHQLRAALDRDPVNADGYRELANAYVAAGRMDDAEATFRRAIQYRPGFWLGYSDLAVFYNDHARYREAEPVLRKALDLTPDNYILYRNLGGVQMALGEWNDAERSFRRAVELRPQGSIYSNLGTLYILLGRYADAVPVLERATQLSGGDRHAYVIWGNLADAYRWTPARRNDAPAAYRKTLQLAAEQLAINPDDAVLLSQMAVYHAKLGEEAAADAGIRKALKLAPKDGAVLFRAGVIYELSSKRTQALAALDAALRAGYSLSVVEREPELAALRNDPAWPAVAAHSREKK